MRALGSQGCRHRLVEEFPLHEGSRNRVGRSSTGHSFPALKSQMMGRVGGDGHGIGPVHSAVLVQGDESQPGLQILEGGLHTGYRLLRDIGDRLRSEGSIRSRKLPNHHGVKLALKRGEFCATSRPSGRLTSGQKSHQATRNRYKKTSDRQFHGETS
jgi:hypothetical protein